MAKYLEPGDLADGERADVIESVPSGTWMIQPGAELRRAGQALRRRAGDGGGGDGRPQHDRSLGAVERSRHLALQFRGGDDRAGDAEGGGHVGGPGGQYCQRERLVWRPRPGSCRYRPVGRRWGIGGCAGGLGAWALVKGLTGFAGGFGLKGSGLGARCAGRRALRRCGGAERRRCGLGRRRGGLGSSGARLYFGRAMMGAG